ncbi:tissue factor pathway inhibitor [Ornithorhynchus anatinus]
MKPSTRCLSLLGLLTFFLARMTLVGSRKSVTELCQLPPLKGQCPSMEERMPVLRYYYYPPKNRCMPFFYNGCGGNRNRFGSHEKCLATCGISGIPPVCQLPRRKGPCKEKHHQYYFNMATRTCEPFIYGGCGGSKNRFQTKEECQMTCFPVGAEEASE